MKTLTITEAKKNLGKWLSAAVAGEEVGIISGAAIVALQPVEVQARPWHEAMPVDREYIRKEYGMTPEQMEAALDRLAARSEREVRAGRAMVIETPTLQNLEKALGDYTRAHPTTRRTAKKRARGRVARPA
jgi:antitoxin (DNA-binding transcriptional repressor) of toxin-antitoxin stability system